MVGITWNKCLQGHFSMHMYIQSILCVYVCASKAKLEWWALKCSSSMVSTHRKFFLTPAPSSGLPSVPPSDLILNHGYIGTPTCPTICISPLWEQSSWLLCMWTLETIQTCSPRVFSHLIVNIKNRDHNQEGSYGVLMTKEAWWQKRNNFSLWYRSGDMLGTNYISVFPILHVATKSLWVDLSLKTLDTTKWSTFPLLSPFCK